MEIQRDICMGVVCFVMCIEVSLYGNDCAPFYCSLDSKGVVEDCNGEVDGEVSFPEALDVNGAEFGGAGHIDFSGDVFNSTSGSVSIWFKKTSIDEKGGIWEIGSVGQENSMGLFYVGKVNVHFEIRGEHDAMEQCRDTGVLSSEYFTHLVCSWEKRGDSIYTIKLFVNGGPAVDVNWTNLNDSYVHNMNPLEIGRDSNYGHCKGIVDEVRFYDWPLSDGEVYAEYVYSQRRYINQPTGKAVSEGPVKIENGKLKVKGESFLIKGVGYQPIPVGMGNSEETREYIYSDPCIIVRDVNNLSRMNANTVRIWARLPNSGSVLLDALEEEGMYAIMGFDVNSKNINYSDPCVIAYFKNEMEEYVNKFKGHPAVLAWAIGNENNLHYDRDVSEWYNLANELARAAYETEGPNYHPTMVVNGSTIFFADKIYGSDDANMNYVDIWGHNAYTYYDYGCYFDYYHELTAKQILITEYGTDAWNNESGSEYQDVQADWVVHEWEQIESQEHCLGGTVMAYSDEWWKCEEGDTYDIAAQELCGYGSDTHPDRFSNEEWYGLMNIEDNVDSVDILEPRQAYCALAEAFGGEAVVWELLITKCRVNAGGYEPGDEMISIGGTMEWISEEAIRGASEVHVGIYSDNNDYLVYNEVLPIDHNDIKKGSYKYQRKVPKGGLGAITSLKLDTKKKRFSLSAKKVDLKGLMSPLSLKIVVGHCHWWGQVKEDVINRKKPIPMPLMRDYDDALRVDTIKAKKNQQTSEDSLLVKGAIAFENEPNLAEKEIVLILDDQVFPIPERTLRTGKSECIYYCTKVDINEIGITTLKFDVCKCTFMIKITKTKIKWDGISETYLRLIIVPFDEGEPIDPNS